METDPEMLVYLNYAARLLAKCFIVHTIVNTFRAYRFVRGLEEQRIVERSG